jgi:hypothetical protein
MTQLQWDGETGGPLRQDGQADFPNINERRAKRWGEGKLTVTQIATLVSSASDRSNLPGKPGRLHFHKFNRSYFQIFRSSFHSIISIVIIKIRLNFL